MIPEREIGDASTEGYIARLESEIDALRSQLREREATIRELCRFAHTVVTALDQWPANGVPINVAVERLQILVQEAEAVLASKETP